VMLTLQLVIYANECSSDSQVRRKTINELLTMENVVTVWKAVRATSIQPT